MALTIQTAANLNKLRAQTNILSPEARQPFANAKAAGEQLSEAIDSFYPNLDETESDGASGQKGLVRYATSQGERIQVQYSGDSKQGEYVHEWVGGRFLYSKFDENSIENYDVSPAGVKHLHVDRQNPENSFVEVSPPGFNLLNQEPPAAKPPEIPEDKFQEKDGVKFAVLAEGHSSEAADRGEDVLVHYTGWLTNGNSFDSSRDKGKPFKFPLGQGKVIQGWEKGVEGMQVGERRLLKIPAELGYGDRDLGRIPPNSTLLFDVELLATSGEVRW